MTITEIPRNYSEFVRCSAYCISLVCDNIIMLLLTEVMLFPVLQVMVFPARGELQALMNDYFLIGMMET